LRAARNLADASRLADALASLDAGAASAGEGLRVDLLRALGEARARNALRWYLDRNAVRAPSRERLDEALRQLLAARADAQPVVTLDAACLRRHRGVIELVARAPAISRGWRAAWRGEAQLALPDDLGTLHFQPAIGHGLSRARLAAGPVSARLRSGGERIKPDAGRPLRTLKNLLREAGVPAWQRERLPILFCGEAPVWVPGVGCDSRFAAARDEPGVLVRWDPPPGEPGLP
jgi:tRNA(Ile)-lysidine synthase